MLLVKLGTFSRYAHACVAISDTDESGHLWIVEAETQGARLRFIHYTEFELWSDTPLTDEQRQKIADAARSCDGIPYDFWAILGFLVRFWGAKWRDTTPDHADDKMICGELVVWAYRQAGVDLFPGIAAGDISPGDLRELLY